MSGVQTNPVVSSVHAAMFKKAIAAATTTAELKAAANKHSPWLTRNDADELRIIYRTRQGQITKNEENES